MSDVVDDALTPRARLARSRAELLQAMGPRDGGDGDVEAIGEAGAKVVARRNALERWWARHPAYTVYEWFEPALHRYARRKPQRLVGYAAGVGGLLAVSGPLRWLAFSGLVAVVTRGPGIADAFSGRWRRERAATADTDLDVTGLTVDAQPVVELTGTPPAASAAR